VANADRGATVKEAPAGTNFLIHRLAVRARQRPSLPSLVHILGLAEDAHVGNRERDPRRAAAEAAASRLDELAMSGPGTDR